MLTATELTERLRHGDKEALFSLMSLFYNDLFRYGIKFTADKDLTKDIIGQFFLHIWDHRDAFSGADNIKNYLIVSFKRFLVCYLKKISRQLNIPENASSSIEYPYEEYIIAWQEKENTRSLLLRIIQSLPAREKQLVQLRFYEQLSYQEISDKTSLSMRTVYNKLHEAIKHIRAHALSENIRKNLQK
jgi:RNA polymerase sigma factor (sigma-70 family)